MKLSPFLMFALTPLALHAHRPLGGAWNATPATTVRDTIQLVYAGERDDTVKITTDSVSKILKGTHLQVIFLRVGSNNGTRITRPAAAKIDPNSVTGVQIEDGDNLIRQYGDVAKPGVLTVMVKQPAPAKDSKNPSSKGRKKG